MANRRRWRQELLVPVLLLMPGMWPVSLFAQAQDGGNQSRAAYELSAAGNDRALWLVEGQWQTEEQKWLQRFAFLEKSSQQIQPAIDIVPQTGRIERCAVVGQDLHVFFAAEPDAGGGAHIRFTTGGSVRELRLPASVEPPAIAGSMIDRRPVLWAVVKGRTADAVERDWQRWQQKQATRPGEDQPILLKPKSWGAEGEPAVLTSQPVERDEHSFHLVQYEARRWRPSLATPEASAGSQRVWLCLVAGRIHFFWQRTANDAEIQHAWHEGDAWSIGRPLECPAHVKVAHAGEVNRQLVFAVMYINPENPQEWRCQVNTWYPGQDDHQDERWLAPVELLNAEGAALSVPDHAAVAAFADSVAVMSMGEQGPELAFWPTGGGEPSQGFRPVPVQGPDEPPSGFEGARDFLSTMIAATLLLLVFWRRQESIANPIALPAGVSISGSAKRALGALVDLAPGALIALWIWHDTLIPFFRDLHAATTSGHAEDSLRALEEPIELMYAWIVARLIYTGYSLVFELVYATTPGKWLFGGRVVSETLNPPNRVQIVIRNVSRLIELEPLLLIFPFLLVIFLTRNRQRLGDLLARTIVVQGQAELPPATDEDEADHYWSG